MVNIIIPHYNDTDNLKKALASLVAQTKQSFIVTIIDDCSPSAPDLLSVIEHYKQYLQLELLINDKNLGPGPTRQVGIDNTNCQYIMFLDSDDMFYPRAVELLSREIQVHDADLVYSDIYAEMNGGKIILKLGENTTWFHGKIYRTEYLRGLGLRLDNLDFRYNEDSYFNLCANILTKKKYFLADEITYLWRNNKKSLTRTKGAQQFLYDHNLEYLFSQVRAVQFMLKKGLKVDEAPLARTIINIYGAYEQEYLIHPENVPIMDQLIVEIFRIPEFVEHLKHEPTLQILVNELKQTKQYNKDLIFFQHTFSSFSGYFTMLTHKEN